MMAHEFPPSFRAALNPRELPALRVERLWALHAELATAPGLAQAALWLPSAWPRLLQLLADAHPDVRMAAVPLLGALGALLAAGREPQLAGRLPPSALFDWGQALLSPTSNLPAAQRMSVESKEAAIAALSACASCLPPSALQPHAQPLLRLTCSLLEASSTPPRLLGPLLRLLLCVLPAVPLAALGHGFGDLADLLCGWALEPLVAREDRRLITLVLHSLRPQWHSHRDLTASLTGNMLDDVRAAAAGVVAAAAAASAASDDAVGDAASQAGSCMQLLQLLCDIVSAASLRRLPMQAPPPALQHASAPGQPALAAHPGRTAQAPGVPQPPHAPPSQPHLGHPMRQVHDSTTAPGLPPPHSMRPPPPPPPPRASLVPQQQQQQQPVVPGAAAARVLAPPPLALAAVLRTRPGVATARHLISLYTQLLGVIKEVWLAFSGLGLLGGGSHGGAAGLSEPAAADGPWAAQLCRCVEILAESVASCVADMDPRDVDEVCEGVDASLVERLAALQLHDEAAGAQAGAATGSAGPPAATQAAHGAVGSALAAVSQEPLGASGVAQAADVGRSGTTESGGGRADAAAAATPQRPLIGHEQLDRSWPLDRGASLRVAVLQAALGWASSLLSGLPAEHKVAEVLTPAPSSASAAAAAGRGAGYEALLSCSARLLRIEMEGSPRVGRRLLAAFLLEEESATGLWHLRCAPQVTAVVAAAQMLQTLLSDPNEALAAATLDVLLVDFERHLRLRRPPPDVCTDQDVEPSAVISDKALTFDCAVLQAACRRQLLRRDDLLRVESAAWNALQGAGAAGPHQTLLLASPPRPAQRPLAASVAAALFDAWAAAALALLAAPSAPPGAHAIGHTQATPQLLGAADPDATAAALRAGCAAYLHALQVPRVARDVALQLRALAALQRLLTHPATAPAGVLREDPLFRAASDTVLPAMRSDDACVRVAATECAAALAAHALQASLAAGASGRHSLASAGGHGTAAQPAVRPAQLAVLHLPPPPPAPDSFSPLVASALDALSDAVPEVAAAAARLTAELTEAALLASMRFGGASHGSWVPAWQDELAVAPQRRALRSAQVARLLELVFQAAAAQQGGVLLRKRAPGAAVGGAAALGIAGDDAEPGGRMAALQRLAYGLAPATPTGACGGEAGAGGGGGGGDAAAEQAGTDAAVDALGETTAERNGAALVWRVLQDGAKQMVAARLRTHLGGPTQTLGALERMLQATLSRLAQERREAGPAGVSASSRDSAWLVLELTGALERAIAHAAEGHPGRDALQQPVLAFFAANKKVCDEWFSRVRELLARIAALASAHHHVIHHGQARLHDLRNTMRQLLASLAQERKAAAAVAAATAGVGPAADVPQPDAQGGGGGAEATRAAAAAAGQGRAVAGGAGQEAAQSGAASGRQGAKQLHRRTGQQPQGHQQPHGAATEQPAAGAPGAGDPAAAPAAAVTALQQVEANLSRLAAVVVELLKLVGYAMLAAGEADGLQGLHDWALLEFDPLLQGLHLPGVSAVAAAAAAAAGGHRSSGLQPQYKGVDAGAGARRRPDATTRRTRSNSKQQDAFSWLHGLSQQAAGAYEQALLTYNAFLAPPRSPASASSTSDGQGSHMGPEPVRSAAAALEMAAAAQSFVVERVAECYAALSDWAGLQGLTGAFSCTATADPSVAAWWPGVAVSIEHKYRALASYDMALLGAPSPEGQREATAHESALGDPTSVLIATMRVLGAAGVASASPPSSHQRMSAAPPGPASLQLARDAAAAELSRLTDRLRASVLSEPTSQREVLLQACCIRAAARGLDAVAAGPSAPLPDAADGPWSGLLTGRWQLQGSVTGRGIGSLLLAPDGNLQTGVIRDVAATGPLLRAARAADPRVALAGTRALALEHIRAAAASGNYGLAVRLVQLKAVAAAADAQARRGVDAFGAAADGGAGAGVNAVLSVAHTLLSAAAARLPAPQVVELQVKALLPHLLAPAALPQQWQRSGQGGLVAGADADADADDLACALCTLARWMLRAGAAQAPRSGVEHPALQERSHTAGPAHGHGRPARPDADGVHRQCQGDEGPARWDAAADWPSLSRQLLAELAGAHAATAVLPVGPSTAVTAACAFSIPQTLLQGYYPAAACCLRALQLSRGSVRAWKAWADLLHRAAREQRARAGRPLGERPPRPPLAAAGGAPPGFAGAREGAPSDASAATEKATAGYGAAAAAYCRYLALAHGQGAVRPEEALQALLQVIQITVRHSAHAEQLLAEHLAMVPPLAWATVAPQLLAQLPGASGPARRLLAAALAAVGRAAPSLVLYPVVVELRAADAAAVAGEGAEGAAAAAAAECAAVPELRALLSELGRARPGLLAGVELLVGEMERLTVLVDERWAALLAEVEVEVARRAVSLQAEAARVAEDVSLSPEQRQSVLASRYSTLLAPAVLLLERQLRATAAQPPATPHERRFIEAVLPRLRAAAAALRDGAGVRDWARPQAAWAPLRAAAAALARRQRQPLPPMADLSPVLAALADSEVPMPGCHDGAAAAAGAAAPAADAVVTVAGVEREVVAMSTKTRPKRVALRGSDGAAYMYLLKGREDLRMDERLMQVLRAIKSMLQADPTAASRDLASIRHYSVTPLGPRAGLIQWVPATTSLFSVFRSWQAATLERHAAMAAARQEGIARAAAEGSPPPPELEPPPAAALSRPMDLFYAALVPALQERGLSSATPRRDWPPDVLRSVLSSLCASAPRALLGRVLWAGGGSAAASWRRQQRYGRSLGVMSCVGHLLGLGDRHPDNILLEGREAGVVHIDYNVCWDKGARLRVPEVVPFRLTQMLVAALGVGGLEGPFRAACEATLACLRRRREALAALVEAVLGDPGVDWAVEREDVAARQDMELAVALNLFVGRTEEVQRHLAAAEESLPALVDGPAAALLSYAEAHVFAEALRGAAADAASRGQQAKAALEAARRGEAEARAIVGAAAQEAASLAAEGAALSAAVPQLLQQCGAWAQQHANTLGVLREASFLEGTLGSTASWRAVESGAALGLLAPVAGPGPLPLAAPAPIAMLPAILGDGSVVTQLPEELVATCHECDRQATELLTRREAALGSALTALTQYGAIVRKLLPPSYPAASYHHRWAQALAALAAGGLSLPAVVQAQALAPREPRPADVATAWQALRGSHRLTAAAAMVLAPESHHDVAAAVTTAAAAGQAGGARTPGRELTGAVAAALGVLREAHVVAAAAARRAGGSHGGAADEDAPEVLAQTLTQGLRRRPQLGDGDATGPGASSAVVAAAAASLRQLVLSAQQRLRSAAEHQGQSAASTAAGAVAFLTDFARLRGEVSGLVAIAAAVADAGQGEAILGAPPLQPPGFRHGGGGSSASLAHHAGGSQLASRSGTPGLSGPASAACPLPWLNAAASGLGRWTEMLQRLAVDVVPEVAGQLHLGGGGGGAAGVPNGLSQAAADLHTLLVPVEEALAMGRDCQRRLAALAELTATYPTRAAQLSSRLSDGSAGGDGAAAEAELRALDAAWMSRESVAAGLMATAARATEGLAEALRRLYGTVLGPARLPPELQAVEVTAAAAMASTVGGEGWAESGAGGHAAAASLVAYWDASTLALGGPHRDEDDADGGSADAGGGADGMAVARRREVPHGMQVLWRCVEAARFAGRSLTACQSVRPAAPAGTDGALAETYGAVLPLLARLTAEHAVSRLAPHLEPHLRELAAKLEVAVHEPHREQRLLGAASAGGSDQGWTREAGKAPERGRRAAPEAPAIEAPELVPFTDFDPRVAGEGESLGGLEDADAEEGGGDEWDAFGEGDALPAGDDGPSGAAGEYDLDLGFQLDLDDGFGDVVEGEGDEAAGSAAPDAGDAAEPTRAVTPAEAAKLVERLAAAAAAAATATDAAQLHPAAADAATASPRPPPAHSWAAGSEARACRGGRLQRLAAYEWLHEHHLLQALPPGDPRVGQGLAQFFASQPPDPLQPSARVAAPSRLALLSALQAALDELPGLEAALCGWEAASGGAVGQVVALLRGTPEQFPVDPALAAQRGGGLGARRQHWLAESRGVAMRVCQVAEALLQFEYSRQGITWASGGAAAVDGFAAHCQLLGRAEVLATLAAGGSEAARAAAVASASSRAAEASRQAAEAQHALEAAQYEESAAGSQLASHLPQLVARALDLPLALQELEPSVRSLAQLLENKLGPALKELSSVSAQHSAAADVASVAAAVASHFERCRQAVAALAEAAPAMAAALAAADATAPLPPDMATEVGFLSAQLLGGPAAEEATRVRAMALLQHLVAPAAALQPVSHVVAELPRAVSQLRGELDTLAAAAGSIAAAVQSKHVLPPVDEQQQQQRRHRQLGLLSSGQPQQEAAGDSAAASQAAQGGSADAPDASGATPAVSVEVMATKPAAEADDAPPQDDGGMRAQHGSALDGVVSSAPQSGRSTATGFAAHSGVASAGALPQPQQRDPGATGAAAFATPLLVAPDHVQHHRSRRSTADEARRRAFAAGAFRRFVAKLEGREAEGASRFGAPVPSGNASAAAAPPATLSVPEQVELLIRQATNVDRLAHMYEGWAAWL